MLVQAAKILRAGGATNIYVVATHGLFAGDACKIIMESCIDEVRKKASNNDDSNNNDSLFYTSYQLQKKKRYYLCSVVKKNYIKLGNAKFL